LIGPVNYIYLWRKRQQVLLVLTVPLISAAFIALVAGYGLLSEGFDVNARAVTFTVLDQNSKARRNACQRFALSGRHYPR
jgi:hypothetical protein